MGIACKGGVPEWRRNLTHELNLDDKPECNNEYGQMKMIIMIVKMKMIIVMAVKMTMITTTALPCLDI